MEQKITVRFSDDEIRDMHQIAKEQDLKVSELVRKAVKMFVESDGLDVDAELQRSQQLLEIVEKQAAKYNKLNTNLKKINAYNKQIEEAKENLRTR